MSGRPPESPPFPSRPLSRPLVLERHRLVAGRKLRLDPRQSHNALALALRLLALQAPLLEAGAHRERHDVPGKPVQDRKSTRLNSSHANISYAVFCLKKKNKD